MEWISVKDRLPDDDSRVIILINGVEVIFGFYTDEDMGWYWYNPYNQDYNNLSLGYTVTHWISLPLAPEKV